MKKETMFLLFCVFFFLGFAAQAEDRIEVSLLEGESLMSALTRHSQDPRIYTELENWDGKSVVTCEPGNFSVRSLRPGMYYLPQEATVNQARLRRCLETENQLFGKKVEIAPAVLVSTTVTPNTSSSTTTAEPAPMPEITISGPASAVLNSEFQISWNSKNATSVELHNGVEVIDVPLSGTSYPAISEDRIFTVIAYGRGGKSVRAAHTVRVTPPPPPASPWWESRMLIPLELAIVCLLGYIAWAWDRRTPVPTEAGTVSVQIQEVEEPVMAIAPPEDEKRESGILHSTVELCRSVSGVFRVPNWTLALVHNSAGDEPPVMVTKAAAPPNKSKASLPAMKPLQAPAKPQSVPQPPLPAVTAGFSDDDIKHMSAPPEQLFLTEVKRIVKELGMDGFMRKSGVLKDTQDGRHYVCFDQEASKRQVTSLCSELVAAGFHPRFSEPSDPNSPVRYKVYLGDPNSSTRHTARS